MDTASDWLIVNLRKVIIYELLVFVLRAGQLDMSTALGLTNYLDKEREYVPWSSALGHLGFIGSMLSMRPSYGYYRVSKNFNNVVLQKHLQTPRENRISRKNCDGANNEEFAV